jgi:acyl-CoA dehydrogenase
MHKLELALSAALRNFPVRPVGWLLWALVFPLGRRAVAPSDRLSHKVASILMTPNEARDRLGHGAFLAPTENHPAGRINSYLAAVIAAEPVERKFQKAIKAAEFGTLDYAGQLSLAVERGLITADERRQLEELRRMTIDTIAVDDFDPEELRSAGYARLVESAAPRAAA